MNDLTHIDLFSGIGGFALAAGWAGFRTVAFCEIEPFCQEVLKARFGAVADTELVRKLQPKGGEQKQRGRIGDSPLLIPDIFALDGTRFRGATLLTGGFPCQPFSQAGKRRGKADDRAIWPQMLRVIHEARPAWVVGENVSGLISMELDSVLADLELEGYATRTFHIGAVGVNAPHRRMRVWIVANRTDGGLSECWPEGKSGEKRQVRETSGNDAPKTDSNARDPVRCGLPGKPRRGAREESADRHLDGESDSDAPDAGGERLSVRQREKNGRGAIWEKGEAPAADSWDIPWLEVATRFCRVDDGLPAWIHARRVARLKALGNAIVPQVAYEIIRGIGEIERTG